MPLSAESGSKIIMCTHCGLPVPPGLVEPGSDCQFCCNGCCTVFAVLHEHGLENFYRHVDTETGLPQRAIVTGKSFAEFDDPSFHELYVRPAGEGLSRIELFLENVHCAACVWLVEKLPVAAPGVADARLDFGRSLAEITWDPASKKLSQIARFLDSLGYAPHPFRGVRVREMRRKEDRALLIRIGVAFACAANVMLIAFALYSDLFQDMNPEFRVFFRWTSLVVALPAVLFSGNIFYRGALASLRMGALHMDLPITLGIGTGFAWGAFNTIRGAGDVYFDSVTTLIFLLLCGRWLQNRQQRAAADAAELLFALAPSTARLTEDGQVREVPVEALVPGMMVEVLAGDAVPADGVVAEGASEIDLSLLTGESAPMPVAAGGLVHAGAVNLASRLLVRVEAAGEATRVGRLMKLVEESARRRAPIVRLADRVSGVFVASVLSLSATSFFFWLRLDPSRAVGNAVSLLIVTCPCALGLATPLAVAAAIGRAAKKGILIKGGDVLEMLARPGRMILDKTGTVTQGRMSVARWAGDESAWRLAAALEAHSPHPISRAIRAAFSFDDRGTTIVTAVRVAGGGLRGSVDGREIAVGSPAFIHSLAGESPERFAAEVARAAEEAQTPILVAVDGHVAAFAALADAPREDAAATLALLRARGWDVELLSGDHPRIVEAAGAALGLPKERCRGGASPEVKVAWVEKRLADGPVVMIGDGVNDAAALSAATVGIGVHGGAEACLAAADIFLTADGLAPIYDLTEGARRTLHVIRMGLAFSLFYNLVGASLALAGVLNPLIAAILMPISSLTVITISYRAKTF